MQSTDIEIIDRDSEPPVRGKIVIQIGENTKVAGTRMQQEMSEIIVIDEVRVAGAY